GPDCLRGGLGNSSYCRSRRKEAQISTAFAADQRPSRSKSRTGWFSRVSTKPPDQGNPLPAGLRLGNTSLCRLVQFQCPALRGPAAIFRSNYPARDRATSLV